MSSKNRILFKLSTKFHHYQNQILLIFFLIWFVSVAVVLKEFWTSDDIINDVAERAICLNPVQNESIYDKNNKIGANGRGVYLKRKLPRNRYFNILLSY